jgi:hypothetical protein
MDLSKLSDDILIDFIKFGGETSKKLAIREITKRHLKCKIRSVSRSMPEQDRRKDG